MYPLLCTKVLRTALQLSCGAVLLTVGACNHRPPAAPAEQPPLMAGEARFHPMSGEEQKALQAALSPFLQSDTPVELWYLSRRSKDNGTFEWCVSPAEAQGEWVLLGAISGAELQQLAEQSTTVEHGDTLDYWQTYQLRTGNSTLEIRTCPAEEFGVHLGNCTPVQARAFHRAIWKLIDKKYGIQKRFDVVVSS